MAHAFLVGLVVGLAVSRALPMNKKKTVLDFSVVL